MKRTTYRTHQQVQAKQTKSRLRRAHNLALYKQSLTHYKPLV